MLALFKKVKTEMVVPTTGTQRSRETYFVTLTVDPITAASALAAIMDSTVPGRQASQQTCNDASPYFLYEKAGEVTFAAGCALEIRLNRNSLQLTTPTGSQIEPLTDRPLSQLQTMLARVLKADRDARSRAFGWATFELSYLLQGLPIADGVGTLLYLFIPLHEARIRMGEAELYVSEHDIAERWKAALQDAKEDMPSERIHVDESSDTSRYVEAVDGALKAIDGNKLSKLILSRSVYLTTDIDLTASYRALRHNNTPARSFLLRLGGIAAAGVSPSAIIEVSSTGTIVAQPLAGTRAFTNDPELNASLRNELLSDPKEIYEHALSVRLAQEEIAAVSVPGTVFIEDFMQVIARGSVQHLASSVRGRLRSDANCWDAFISAFPAVTASGIPKRAACQEISLREPFPRGLYSGAVLTVGSNGELDAALVLRSIYQVDGATWLQAGAGLISQSNAKRELEETREKMRSVSRFLVPQSRRMA